MRYYKRLSVLFADRQACLMCYVILLWHCAILKAINEIVKKLWLPNGLFGFA